MDEDAGAVRADLTRRIEIAEHRAADGAFKVGIVEHDDRGLAAKFHRDVLQMFARLCHDALGRRHGAGQRNLGRQAVIDECGSHIAEALHDIEQSVGQSSFLVGFGQRQSRKRRVF